MDSAKYAALFLSDSRDQLRQCEEVLEAWERAPADTAGVDTLFRAFHTIKGMAATMGYARLAAFAHEAEHLLEAVRAGRVPGSAALVALAYEVVDALAAAVEDAVAGHDGRRIDTGLQGRVAEAAGGGAEGDGAQAMPAPVADAPMPGGGLWVRLMVKAGVPMPWARALLALRRAGEMGQVQAVTPAPARVDPERFDGRLGFQLVTGRSAAEVREALLATGDLATVEVERTGGAAAEPSVRVREEVRVPRHELDRLLVEVGELVVAGRRLTGALERRGDPALEALAAELTRWSDAVHHRVLQARTVPMAEVFDRFPRVVRELGRDLGKAVRVELHGREVELDRSVLEAVGDPLLHLVRNAIDHGIEAPAERRAAGKAAEGLIRLEARRDRAAVEISIADDGRGIDRERVRRRLGAAAPLEDDGALLEVLARPGFSTAETVTGVSGRGVGVDAALSRVRALGGSVRLATTAGQGTRFTLLLPETLAVVPALLVTAAAERYAVPMARVAETGGAVPAPHGAGLCVSFRGATLEAVDLRRCVGLDGPAPEGRRPFLVVEGRQGRRALVVDRLLGRQDLVVASLDSPRGAPPWLAGAATLADGIPALLIDPSMLVSAEAA